MNSQVHATLTLYDSHFTIESGEKDGQPAFFVSEHTEKGIANQYIVSTYLEAITRFAYCIDTQAQFHLHHDSALTLPDNGVLTSDACIEGSRADNYENKLLVLNPSRLRPEYRIASQQLFLATSGFGCSPTARGSMVYGISLYDGKEDAFGRDSFMGIADIGKLPGWARSAWHEINTLNKGIEARKQRESGPTR